MHPLCAASVPIKDAGNLSIAQLSLDCRAVSSMLVRTNEWGHQVQGSRLKITSAPINLRIKCNSDTKKIVNSSIDHGIQKLCLVAKKCLGTRSQDS